MEKPDRDYPLNQWYAAAFAGEVARQPLARTICDQQVVLFRTQAGVATALVDRCPHRKAPLSAGQLVGDNIECPFHGMQFAPDGACTRIPSQESIPPAAHIRSFPLVERHGHLWIWMGGQTADPALIPDMHWLTDPAVTAVKGSLALKCNYLLALDNLIDDTHLSFVHRRSIGTPKIAQAPMVAIASPPRRWPMNAQTAPYRLIDSPPWAANTPIRMNSGITLSPAGNTDSKGARPSTKPSVLHPLNRP